ncbi:MAG: hypothetical protein AAF518_16500 [Spirochaetota bacterium]
MQEIIKEIFSVFRDNGIKANQVLQKAELTKKIQSLPPELKMQLRDAWHTLVAEQIIQEGNPQGPILTVKGEQFVYSRE